MQPPTDTADRGSVRILPWPALPEPHNPDDSKGQPPG